MKKLTFLTFLCALLTVPLLYGQAKLNTSVDRVTTILYGPVRSVALETDNVDQTRFENTQISNILKGPVRSVTLKTNNVDQTKVENTLISKDYSRAGRAHCNPDYTVDITGSLPPGGAPAVYSGDCTGISGCNDFFDLDLLLGDTVTLSLCAPEGGSATFDTGLSVWDGVGFPNQLACNDDSCGLQSFLIFIAPADDTYRFRVGGFAGANGPYELSIDRPAAGPPPPLSAI